MSAADRKSVLDPLLAYADDATDEKRDAVVAAFSNAKAGPLLCAMLRSTFVKQHDQGVWDAIAYVLLHHLITLRPADKKTAGAATGTRAGTNLDGWKQFFDNQAHAMPSPVPKAPAQRVTSSRTQKVALKLPTFDGSRGFARQWWSELKLIPERAVPAITITERNEWVNLIWTALGGKNVTQQYRTIVKKHQDDDFACDIIAAMGEFARAYDQHSLSQLLAELWPLKQRASESITDFRTRFERLVEALGNQEHKMSLQNQFHIFKEKVLDAAYLREHPDIATIEAAVRSILLRETSGLRVKPSAVMSTQNPRTPQCWNCGAYGHAIRDCRQQKDPRRTKQNKTKWRRRNSKNPLERPDPDAPRTLR